MPISSDSVTHSFFLQQLHRFKTLPYGSHFYWGNKDFNYPAGFATFNYIWLLTTQIPPHQIIVINTMLHIIMSLLVIAESFYQRKEKYLFPFILIIIISFYYNFASFGYQESFFDLKGTARLFVPVFDSILLCFFINFIQNRFDNIVNYFATTNFLLILFACVTFLLNPILAVINIITISLIDIISIIKAKSIKVSLKVLSTLFLFVFILIDPYIFNRIFNPSTIYTNIVDGTDITNHATKIGLSSMISTILLSVKKQFGSLAALNVDTPLDFDTSICWLIITLSVLFIIMKKYYDR